MRPITFNLLILDITGSTLLLLIGDNLNQVMINQNMRKT